MLCEYGTRLFRGKRKCWEMFLFENLQNFVSNIFIWFCIIHNYDSKEVFSQAKHTSNI